MDFDQINEALNSAAPAQITVKLVTLGGVSSETAEAGITVAAFRRAHNISADKKLVDSDSNVLRDTDRLDADCQIFVSVPKQNG